MMEEEASPVCVPCGVILRDLVDVVVHVCSEQDVRAFTYEDFMQARRRLQQPTLGREN